MRHKGCKSRLSVGWDVLIAARRRSQSGQPACPPHPVCGTPGDSGGCEMGLAADTIMAVVPGIQLGIVVGGALGLRSRSRRKP
jgi:hypothetical protein